MGSEHDASVCATVPLQSVTRRRSTRRGGPTMSGERWPHRDDGGRVAGRSSTRRARAIRNSAAGQQEQVIKLASTRRRSGRCPPLDAITAAVSGAVATPTTAAPRSTAALAARLRGRPLAPVLPAPGRLEPRREAFATIGIRATRWCARWPSFEAYPILAAGGRRPPPRAAPGTTTATTSTPWPTPSPSARGLVFVCNPNNPTGTTVHARRATRFP